jgi:hypothetical protein
VTNHRTSKKRCARQLTARAIFVADSGGGGAAAAVAELRALKAQVAATEDALDRANELTSPGGQRFPNGSHSSLKITVIAGRASIVNVNVARLPGAGTGGRQRMIHADQAFNLGCMAARRSTYSH